MRTLNSLQADDIRTAVTLAERHCGLRFAVYIGPAKGPRRHFAERLHAALGAASADSVLIMVDGAGRALEIVTGERARRRLPDGDCRIAAMAMATAFSLGDLPGGILAGLAALSQRAIRG